jgi:hypothetical protein
MNFLSFFNFTELAQLVAMLRGTEPNSMYSRTVSLLKNNRIFSNTNQYGLKPVRTMDYLCPTMLVNFGRSSGMDTLETRMGGRFGADSSPSMNGFALVNQAEMLGISKRGNPETSLSLCSSETSSLRVCMAKGTSSCEHESAVLDSCLSRVKSVKSAITGAGNDYMDWYNQQVSDNYTKPFQHRPHDWRHMRAQEEIGAAKGSFNSALGRHPKKLVPQEKFHKVHSSKNARLPYNK